MGTFHSQFDDDKPEKGGSHHTVPLSTFDICFHYRGGRGVQTFKILALICSFSL